MFMINTSPENNYEELYNRVLGIRYPYSTVIKYVEVSDKKLFYIDRLYRDLIEDLCEE